MKYSTVINGLNVEAVYSDSFIESTVIPLLHKWTEMYSEKNRRILVFLAAPPGAGKSTMVDLFTRVSSTIPGVIPIAAIGMDGFHHYQDYLLSHTTDRDGKMVSMVEIKGAPITFDLEALADRISKLKSEEEVFWPIYDRTTHNPKDNAILVKENIVLLEGNYLLLKEEGWSKLAGFADMTISITADPLFLRKRLIDRKYATCNDIDKATAFVDYSDMANVNVCLEKSAEADIVIGINEAGEYTGLG